MLLNDKKLQQSFDGGGHCANHVIETFDCTQDQVVRTLTLKKIQHTSTLPLDKSIKFLVDKYNLSLGAAFDLSWLKSIKNPFVNDIGNKHIINIVDLFCGIGGISLGIQHAIYALGMNPKILFANDISPTALEIFNKNLKSKELSEDPVEEIFDGELGTPLTNREKSIKIRLGRIDFLVGGPPCQGHSDLNNHTRRADPKNELYLSMARAAEVLDATVVLIENVPGVRHDHNSVVGRTETLLRTLGYELQSLSLNAAEYGVAQRRKRFFLLAYKSRISPAPLNQFVTESRPLAWAIDDLKCKYDPLSIFNSSSNHSQENKRRIEFLFTHNIFELPDSERPDCHKYKNHSYKSVYGRLKWDEVSPTITGGFGSTGQGRFVHPLFPRTLTPHEAARVQYFPDFFDFEIDKRRELQQLIGNAVPSKIGYIIGLATLPLVLSSEEY